MNKILVTLMILANILVIAGIARADETTTKAATPQIVMVCAAPRPLDMGTVGSHVQVCEMVKITASVVKVVR